MLSNPPDCDPFAAALGPIADSYTYIPEDQPLLLARHIDEFIKRLPDPAGSQ
jgi:hypothetical protein